MDNTTTFINGLTNTYVVTNGIIQSNAPQLTEAFTRLNTPFGSYKFDPNFGCLIPLWLQSRQPLTEKKVEQEIERTLQPMINKGRAVGFLITINAMNNNAIMYTVDIYSNNSKPFSLISNFTG